MNTNRHLTIFTRSGTVYSLTACSSGFAVVKNPNLEGQLIVGFANSISQEIESRRCIMSGERLTDPNRPFQDPATGWRTNRISTSPVKLALVTSSPVDFAE